MQVGYYYFHEAGGETWDDANTACTDLDLTWVDVNDLDRAENLKISGLGV